MKTNTKDIKKLKNKTFILNFTIKKESIKKEYQSVIQNIQSEIEAKGFRKGKAPLNIVEQQASPEKIIQEILTNLVSQNYSDKIKKHELKPVIQPQVKITNPPITLDKDWQVEIIGCELPQIELDDKVFQQIKTLNKSKTKEENKEQKINKIIEILEKSVKVELPSILTDSDVENRLSHLVEQTNQAGITINQYLKSKNQTLEQYKENIKEQVVKEWKLNLTIDKIAHENKIKVSQEEVKKLLEKSPQLSSNINLAYYLLTQQKVFEYLENLQ